MRKSSGTYLGAVCGKGHDGLRYVSTNMCVGCSKSHYEKTKEQRAKKYLEVKDQIKSRRAERAKQYYRENRERLLVQQKQYYESNKELWNLKTHKRRAAGLPNHILLSDIRKLRSLQKNKCTACKQELLKYHIDHIKPLSKGGKHEFNNLQLLCPLCNLTKSAKDPVDFMRSKGYLL
jgi:5-methylcytosine-specific restriction endonuclease McrA